jgi:hypothetical protein
MAQRQKVKRILESILCPKNKNSKDAKVRQRKSSSRDRLKVQQLIT